ncbi:hypothetical protein MLGJGCBP_08940 [Rhodococcus sp. T7]|nr:hypothetical protein MLGJGCBP_08940 [Rhodococcus sp. T7]
MLTGIPRRMVTAAATCSPSSSCGSATTIASATAGWVVRAAATWAQEMFSPPRMMMSFERPLR